MQALFTDSPLTGYDTLDSVLHGLVGDEGVKNSVELSFKMRVMSGTRSSDAVLFKNEYVVSHVEFFFFDAMTKKLVKKKAFENLAVGDDALSKEYDVSYFIESARIKVGVYNIFAIANYTDVADDISNQDEFLDLVDASTYSGV